MSQIYRLLSRQLAEAIAYEYKAGVDDADTWWLYKLGFTTAQSSPSLPSGSLKPQDEYAPGDYY